MKKKKRKVTTLPHSHLTSEALLLQHTGGGNLNKIKRMIVIVIKRNNTW